MNKKLHKEWLEIVSFSAIDLMSFKNLEEIPEFADKLYFHIKDIFTVLSKIKTNRVYSKREIETIFTLIKESIYSMNDIFIYLNIKDLPSLTYEIIYNITEELILLLEDNEHYEGCQNLLTLRDYWFRLMMVKINDPIDVKK